MKDIFRILDKSKKAHLQKIVLINSSDYPNSQWQAINLIESSAKQMMGRIEAALPKGYKKNIIEVDLDLYEKPGKGEKLFVKAQLYPETKYISCVKIFVHETDSRNKSIKIARAIYQIKLVDKVGKAA